LLQPFYDIFKLLEKGETISETASWVTHAAPLVGLAAIVAASLMSPWLGFDSPISGDAFLLIYLLVLVKFSTSLLALDTGSSFGAIGASRESSISVFTEPAMIAALAALGLHSHSSSLPAIFAGGDVGLKSDAVAGLAAIALWMAAMADLSRMPFDDPGTHLELTMIHEAQILENSGRNLALVQLATALRSVVLIGLTARAVELLLPPMPILMSYGVTIGMLALSAVAIALGETVLVRLRWDKMPNLLSFAVVAAMAACLMAAIRG
jgi:formate hydrogenlyase subunit 4